MNTLPNLIAKLVAIAYARDQGLTPTPTRKDIMSACLDIDMAFQDCPWDFDALTTCEREWCNLAMQWTRA